ncbi:hypothetical protein OG196_14000 [Kitasatospora purpeofusca]|uniref:hypothetical protein n=1 Tax=Kitasatospora purpeofusca TaxID=67352 RepID=UPI002E147A78|nr:hypothetical protein OG196_14000 [Kitasatospora purpeofusca]
MNLSEWIALTAAAVLGVAAVISTLLDQLIALSAKATEVVKSLRDLRAAWNGDSDNSPDESPDAVRPILQQAPDAGVDCTPERRAS